jgi:hypothetical protein
MSGRSSIVPKSMQATYDAVVALTAAFCHHLTADYRDLAQALIASLARNRRGPLVSG